MANAAVTFVQTGPDILRFPFWRDADFGGHRGINAADGINATDLTTVEQVNAAILNAQLGLFPGDPKTAREALGVDVIYTQLSDIPTAKVPTGRESIVAEHLGTGYAPSMMPLEKVASIPAQSIRTQDILGNWYVGNRRYFIPQDFGWKPGDDIAPAMRAAYAEIALTKRTKQLLLTTDPSRSDGSYRCFSPDPAATGGNDCVQITDPNASFAQLIGLGQDLTSIQYDHAAAYALAGNVRSPRRIFTLAGVGGLIQGVTFDGREQDRVPYLFTLVGGIGAGDTTITVDDSTLLPATNGHLLLESEYIVYLAKGAANTLTGCVRGCRGTTAAGHSDGTPITFQLRTGHHGLSVKNFPVRFVLEDVGVKNAIAYGVGIENTGTQSIKHLQINLLRVDRSGSDGIDIKCPVVDGNRYAVISNCTFRSWSIFSGWVTNNDNGLDNRTQGARFDNLTFIYTTEMGGANALSHRASQVAGTDPDNPDAQSGGQYSAYGSIVLEGANNSTSPHTGLSLGGADSNFGIVVARNLNGYAVNMTGDRAHISQLATSSCLGGAIVSGADCSISAGNLTSLTNEGVYLLTDARGASMRNIKADGGTINFRSVGLSTGEFLDCDGTGFATSEYQLATGMRVKRTPGEFKTITSADSPYTMSFRDTTLYCDSTAGNITVIPMNPTSDGRSFQCRIMKTVAANTVTIDPPGSTHINGSNTVALTAQYQEVALKSDGTEYKLQVTVAGLTAPHAPSTAFLTGSGNWTAPADPTGFVYARFAFVTAGGGGGAVANPAAITTATSGTPGYTGSLQLKIASGTVVAYVNGAGGAGGAAGNNNGANGANSTITVGATTYTFAGGIGGAGSATGNAAATTTQTLAALNAAMALMAITPTTDAFYVAPPRIEVIGVGATNIGGQARDTVYGTAGVAAVNAAGGNAAGYGNAGAGAGHDAATLSNLAGGNGSAGCMLVTF